MDNKNFKNPNFWQALKNSFNGFFNVYTTQRNIIIQSIIAIMAIIVAFVLKISLIEWAILVITIFIVLTAEFVNTSIEQVVDMITKEYNEEAKKAKDIAAAAVTLTSVMAVIVGIILFLPKIIILIK